MQIVTVQFDKAESKDYSILLDVYRESVRRNMHGVKFVEIKIPPPEDESGRGLFCHFNHAKLEAWAWFLNTAEDDTVFTDCDMLALNKPTMAFREDFDIGYTVRTREGANYPINGGVVFARPTQAAKAFFKMWVDFDDMMLRDKEFHDVWVQKYSGLNQSSFGYMLETMPEVAKLHEFKTYPFNCVECDWKHVNGSENFVHIKTRLRRACLSSAKGNHIPEPARVQFARELWYDIYRRLEK